METVKGIPGQIPSLAPFPDLGVRNNVPLTEWQACLDAWISNIELRLRLLPEHFACFQFSQDSSGISFLSSYFFSSTTQFGPTASFPLNQNREHKLRRRCLLLLRRLLLEGQIPFDCSATELFNLISKASIQLRGSQLWKDTLRQTWLRQESTLSIAIEVAKVHLIKMLAIGSKDRFMFVPQLLPEVTALAQCLPEAGKIIMTGSDYIDTLAGTYNDLGGKLERLNSKELRKILIENLFSGLQSLMKGQYASPSLLFDDLYDLKSSADTEARANPNKVTLLSDLVCSTSFVLKLEAFLATSSSTRGNSILQLLQPYRRKMSYLHSTNRAKRARPRSEKGKHKLDNNTHEMHIHKASHVSQIYDLFPDVPSSHVLRLLDHFSDDIEAVTAALLEPKSLPKYLQDHTDPVEYSNGQVSSHPEGQDSQLPSSSLPLSSRNVFDGDDFDELRISTSQVHIGRKEYNSESSINPSEVAKKKAAIMAALATFDPDDDERDDTYDIADVGGAVDNTLDTDEKLGSRRNDESEKNERILHSAWTSNPELFTRDSRVRLSQPRQQLKIETGMTNEQIEDWALVLSRDSVQQRKLGQRYVGPTSFGGRQKALGTTRWSADRSRTGMEDDTNVTESGTGNEPAASGLESVSRSSRGATTGKTGLPRHLNDSSAEIARGHVGQDRGRGRGRGGGGRGGNVNHNRREGRARKMAGRGFGGPSSS